MPANNSDESFSGLHRLSKVSIEQHPPQKDYRADIDGLRAFAVLSVLAFHANFVLFGGGFIGVDVFFVISGYLISGIIFNKLERGTFTFGDFYARRVNRIFPALIAMLLATAILGWLFLFRSELEALGRHIVGGAVYGSNFILWNEAGYFDSPLKPLLHLWSLSVEEQFYLLFPFVAVSAWKMKWNMRWVLTFMIAISFAINVWAVRNAHATAAFYMPFTRMWEILVGCLLVTIRDDGSLQRLIGERAAGVVREVLSAAGITGLIMCVLLVDETMTWPGAWGLLPVAATVSIIAGGRGSKVNCRLLGHPWVVGIGLVSYPLYLWHWPLLVFAKLIYEREPPTIVRFAILVFSLLLAFVTYRLIETPIRFSGRKRRSAIRLVPVLGAVGGLGFLFAAGIIPPLLEVSKKRSVAVIGADWETPRGGSIREGKQFLIYRIPGDSSREIVLLGDSHAQQYWPRVLELAADRRREGPQITLIAYAGCPLIPRMNRQGTSWDGNEWNCPRFYGAAMKYASSERVESVVLANFWEDYFTRALLMPAHGNGPAYRESDAEIDSSFAQLTRDVASLTAHGKKVYVVLSNPTLISRDLGRGLPRRLAGFTGQQVVPVVSRRDFNGRVAAISARLRRLSISAGATVIDPAAFLCRGDSCPTVGEGGIPIYRDYDHLRAGFVRRDVLFLDSAFR